MVAIAQRQWLITVSSPQAHIAGFWATRTGGDTTVEHSKARDGGNPVADLMQGPGETADVVVSRPWKPERDATIDAALRRRLEAGFRTEVTISQTPTDSDYTPLGPPLVWVGQLKAVKSPEANADSNTASMFELTFTTQSTSR